jgi:hypothetical protein
MDVTLVVITGIIASSHTGLASPRVSLLQFNSTTYTRIRSAAIVGIHLKVCIEQLILFMHTSNSSSVAPYASLMLRSEPKCAEVTIA